MAGEDNTFFGGCFGVPLSTPSPCQKGLVTPRDHATFSLADSPNVTRPFWKDSAAINGPATKRKAARATSVRGTALRRSPLQRRLAARNTKARGNIIAFAR